MNIIKKRFAKSCMMVALVLFTFEIVSPQTTRAQMAVEDPTNFGVNLISSIYNVYQDVSTQYLKLKETVLDPLAWALAKSLLQSITADVVDWINSGFQGSPAFLSNPQGFFLDVADQATGAFIANSGPLSELCAPFSLDIRLNLALQSTQSTRKRYACTLSTIINNAQNSNIGISGTVTENGNTIAGAGVGVGGNSINGFMGGDFSQGGWPAFIAMTTEPQNNYIGAYLTAQSDLQSQISSRQTSIREDLVMGGGFMSYQKCTDLGTVTNEDDADTADAIAGNDPNVTTKLNSDGSVTYQMCHTETPGSTISAALNKQLGAGSDSLIAADELDEILSAAFNQLIKKVLVGGLYSSSQASSGGGTRSVMNTLRTDTTGTQTQNNVTDLNNQINKYLPDTREYNTIRSKTIGIVMDMQTYASQSISKCMSSGQGANATVIQGILNTKITPLVNDFYPKATLAATRLSTLTDLQTKLSSPNATDPNQLNILSQQFSGLLSSGNITTAIDIKIANNELTAVQSSAATIYSDIASQSSSCI